MSSFEIFQKTFYDAFVFAIICFIIFWLSTKVVWPKQLEGSDVEMALYFGVSIFLLSFVMMCMSGKYSNNPITNHASYTPWTWWKFKK